MPRRPLFPLLLALLLPSLLTAQPRAKLERAQREFATGNYPAAVRTLAAAGRLDGEGALLLAVSRFHAGDLLQAEADLLSLGEAENEPLSWFYLGRVYHAQHRFDRAAVEYKRYLRSLGGGDGPERNTVIDLLRNVDNGIRAGYVSEEMIAENLGPETNGEFDEYAPIPSPTTGARLYFSVVRPRPGEQQPQSDIVFSQSQGGGWGPPTDLNPLVNTNRHESLVDISPDGRKLFYYRGDGARDGNFLVDTFRAGGGAGQLVTLSLDAPIRPAGGDAAPFFGAPDGIYFASDRPGGYGGLDLYCLPYRPGGGFGPAVNLGPNVNGPYDEVTPFLARDGNTLYFSTNDPDYSVGGFDVVRSFRIAGSNHQYIRPANAGMPLNSAGDDTHFRLANDTFTGFLASDRKDGYGARDLYIVYFVEARTEMR